MIQSTNPLSFNQLELTKGLESLKPWYYKPKKAKFNLSDLPFPKSKFNQSHWTQFENKLYIQFLTHYKDLLHEKPQVKRKYHLNRIMSKYIKTRSPIQCRSHHQKMMKTYHSIDKIIQQNKKQQVSLSSPNDNETPKSEIQFDERLLMAATDAFQVFYSKDLNKKKKTYSEGFIICTQHKTKLFSSDGECLTMITNKNSSLPQIDQEYTLNHKYLDKKVEYENFVNGKLFMHVQENTLTVAKKKFKANSSLHKIALQVGKEFTNGLIIQKFIFQTLRPHQVEGVNFMYQCISGQRGQNIEGCILADFMGLGKTLQALTLIRCAIIKKVTKKAIVVAPLTLVKVWERQCLKWFQNKLSPIVTLGQTQEIEKAIRMFTHYEYRLLVTTYQHFQKYIEELNKVCDLLIFDEGHRLKNKKGKLFKKLNLFKCKKRILLTGTPLQNNLTELYTCITLVNPLFFQSENMFKNIFQSPILTGISKHANKEQKMIALERTIELSNKIKTFSLRRKADILEQYLPIKRQYQIFFKMTPLQLQIYNRSMKKNVVEANSVMEFLNQMRKLFTHPILFKNDRFENYTWIDCQQDCREQASPKIDFIKEIVTKAKIKEQKVVIVSYFTQTLDFIGTVLKQAGIRSVKLDGRVQGKDRLKIVDSFSKQGDVLLLSGKAGGTGLTLVCATKMIMIQPDWNPSNDSQVMGRIWRQGQEKEVQIYRLFTASTFEQKILQRQQLKQTLSQKLIDDRQGDKSYDFSTLKQLYIEGGTNCLTYSSQQNELKQWLVQNPNTSWNQVVHVHINKSHAQPKDKFENQFQNANFQQIGENQAEQDQADNQIEINQELATKEDNIIQDSSDRVELNQSNETNIPDPNDQIDKATHPNLAFYVPQAIKKLKNHQLLRLQPQQ